jgi:phospholipid/cholesterol/gamma-HCH transport system ATP-binding protein
MSEATTEPVISVRDVVVSYGGRRVLNGINLDIRRGETMVLLGGSGSGKSTLLRHIIGLEQPEAGRILVNGIDLATSSQKDLKSFGARSESRFKMLRFSTRCRSKTT